jgi:hypothetical protein
MELRPKGASFLLLVFLDPDLKEWILLSAAEEPSNGHDRQNLPE